MLLTDKMHGLEHGELVELPLVVRPHWRTCEALVAKAQPSLAKTAAGGLQRVVTGVGGKCAPAWLQQRRSHNYTPQAQINPLSSVRLSLLHLQFRSLFNSEAHYNYTPSDTCDVAWQLKGLAPLCRPPSQRVACAPRGAWG